MKTVQKVKKVQKLIYLLAAKNTKLSANIGHDIVAKHWPIILVIILLLIVLTKLYTKASDKAKVKHYVKKQNKIAQKQYRQSEKDAIRIIDRILGLLKQQMSYVEDPSGLQYFEQQYQSMRDDLSKDRQVQVSAYDLYNLYVKNYNDTQSQLASEMYQLTKFFKN